MENNNLSLYLEEAEKERTAKKVKKIKRTIKILSAVLLALIIYLIKVM